MIQNYSRTHSRSCRTTQLHPSGSIQAHMTNPKKIGQCHHCPKVAIKCVHMITPSQRGCIAKEVEKWTGKIPGPSQQRVKGAREINGSPSNMVDWMQERRDHLKRRRQCDKINVFVYIWF